MYYFISSLNSFGTRLQINRYHFLLYSPENTIVTGLEVTSDRFFMATPRLRAGVPAVLSWIPRNTTPTLNALLQPYPNWSYHTSGQDDFNCSGLISVYRARADSCNRLWVNMDIILVY